jgi:hypothetical protein
VYRPHFAAVLIGFWGPRVVGWVDANTFGRASQAVACLIARCPSSHGLMANDSRLTLEHLEQYMIKAKTRFSNDVDFAASRLGEIGRLTEQRSEFHSRKKSTFLTLSEIAAINDFADLK